MKPWEQKKMIEGKDWSKYASPSPIPRPWAKTTMASRSGSCSKSSNPTEPWPFTTRMSSRLTCLTSCIAIYVCHGPNIAFLVVIHLQRVSESHLMGSWASPNMDIQSILIHHVTVGAYLLRSSLRSLRSWFGWISSDFSSPNFSRSSLTMSADIASRASCVALQKRTWQRVEGRHCGHRSTWLSPSLLRHGQHILSHL